MPKHTPSEKRKNKIGRKISLLTKEGRKPDQAAAIAHSLLKEGKI